MKKQIIKVELVIAKRNAEYFTDNEIECLLDDLLNIDKISDHYAIIETKDNRNL